MTFAFTNPLIEPSWNEWVLEHEAASIFHTVEWARVLTECYRYPVHYGVLKEGQQVVGLLPMMEVASFVTGRRGVSLPFSDECASLLSKGVSLESLVEPMRVLGRERGWEYLELRGEAGSVPGAARSDEHRVHYLSLEGSEEAQVKRLGDSHRRNIQKARKAGVEIQRLQTREAMDAYYALHCLTRQRQGVPPQSRHFFHAVHECVIARGHGFVLLARFQGQWIAGAVYLHFGPKALYKFGGSNLAFQQLRANNLLMWEAIRHRREAGLKELSFGRTDPSNLGLLQFKRGWGANELTLAYYRMPVAKGMHFRRMDPGGAVRTGSKIMQHMPIAMLRLLGSLAYRHMG